jgi:hypothetical protein
MMSGKVDRKNTEKTTKPFSFFLKKKTILNGDIKKRQKKISTLELDHQT